MINVIKKYYVCLRGMCDKLQVVRYIETKHTESKFNLKNYAVFINIKSFRLQLADVAL